MRSPFPDGWTPRPETERMFLAHYDHILRVVRGVVVAFKRIGYLNRDDLESEGLSAAFYAVELFLNDARDGNMFTFIYVVVGRHLKDLVARKNVRAAVEDAVSLDEVLCSGSECTISLDDPLHVGAEGCVDEPPFVYDPEDLVDQDASGALRQVSTEEDDIGVEDDRVAFLQWRNRVVGFWSGLNPRDRGVLYLRLCPPPELVVLNRNLVDRCRSHPSSRAIAVFTGLSEGQVHRSLLNCRRAACVLRVPKEVGV
jgi:hypothetical protein